MAVQRVKRLHARWETRVRSLGQEVPLEKEMVTHFSILAWRIPWMEQPGGLQSMGLQRVGHDSMSSLLLTIFYWNIVIYIYERRPIRACKGDWWFDLYWGLSHLEGGRVMVVWLWIWSGPQYFKVVLVFLFYFEVAKNY